MCEPKEDQVVPETPVELIMDHLSICMAGRRAARALCAMSTEQLQQVGQQIARKEKALKKRRWKQKLLWEAAPPPLDGQPRRRTASASTTAMRSDCTDRIIISGVVISNAIKEECHVCSDEYIG
jgi:hypothetical protein